MSKTNDKDDLIIIKQKLAGFNKINRIPTKFINSNFDKKDGEHILNDILFFLSNGDIDNFNVCKKNITSSKGAIMFEKNIQSEQKIKVVYKQTFSDTSNIGDDNSLSQFPAIYIIYGDIANPELQISILSNIRPETEIVNNNTLKTYRALLKYTPKGSSYKLSETISIIISVDNNNTSKTNVTKYIPFLIDFNSY